MTELAKINNDDANMTIELDTLLDEVQLCIEKCRTHHTITGIGKLERKFRAEERFLKRVSIPCERLFSSDEPKSRAIIKSRNSFRENDRSPNFCCFETGI